MTNERDEILDELRALVSIEPTAGFETRVRREVERGAARRVWWPWVAVGVVVSAVVVVALINRVPPGVAVATPTVASAIPVAPTVPTRARRPAAEVAVRVQGKSVRATLRGVSPQRAEPEVLVPPDRAIALAKFMAGVREGRVLFAPSVGSDGPVVVAPLPELVPVMIERLPEDSAEEKPKTDSKKAGDDVPTQV